MEILLSAHSHTPWYPLFHYFYIFVKERNKKKSLTFWWIDFLNYMELWGNYVHIISFFFREYFFHLFSSSQFNNKCISSKFTFKINLFISYCMFCGESKGSLHKSHFLLILIKRSQLCQLQAQAFKVSIFRTFFIHRFLLLIRNSMEW